MAQDTHAQLLRLSEVFGEHRGISHWRVSALVGQSGRFFKRLRDGQSCTLKTAESVMQWFSAHWPADLPWPEDIPRPAVAAAEGEARG